MKVLISCFLMLMISISMFAQKDLYVHLGDYGDSGLYASVNSDGKTAKLKNVSLHGETKDYSLVAKVNISCRDNTVTQTWVGLYDEKNLLLDEDSTVRAPIQVREGSVLDSAMKIWCDRNPV